MRDLFLAALVVGALFVIIYCAAVLIARVTDRWETRVIPRSSIVPATTTMIDTDENWQREQPRHAPPWPPLRVDTDEYDTDDVHPETITQMVARIEAEEQAAREAKRAQA